MPESISTSPSWQSDRTHLIANPLWKTRKWMGGCPHGQSLTAWSQTLECEVIMLLPCRRWGCSHCGVVRAADLSRRIVAAKPTKFITLTVSNCNWDSPREAYDETRRRLPKWSTKVRKQVGEFEYVRVLEVTKKGWPHYHLMARCGYIPQRTLSLFWADLTGSPIVDIRAIRSGQNSVNYCCKYLRKQLYCSFTSRRVSWTKHFFPQPDNSDRTNWHLVDKQHDMRHPVEIAEEQWGRVPITRIGPYAWTCREIATPEEQTANLARLAAQAETSPPDQMQ